MFILAFVVHYLLISLTYIVIGKSLNDILICLTNIVGFEEI